MENTAFCTQTKKIFESVAKQHFQKFSWFGCWVIATTTILGNIFDHLII